MTITVDAVKRATIKLGRDATVLELLQALTENLGGEWDDATLSVLRGAPAGGWTLVASIEDSGPARAERWATEDGEHVATVISAVPGAEPIRQCSCGVVGADSVMSVHLEQMAAHR